MYMKGAARQIKSLTLLALQSIGVRQADSDLIRRLAEPVRQLQETSRNPLPMIRSAPSNPAAPFVEHMDVFGWGGEGRRLPRRRRVPAANFGHHQFVVGAAHMGV